MIYNLLLNTNHKNAYYNDDHILLCFAQVHNIIRNINALTIKSNRTVLISVLRYYILYLP